MSLARATDLRPEDLAGRTWMAADTTTVYVPSLVSARTHGYDSQRRELEVFGARQWPHRLS